ncbi:hypothetical protein ACQCN2_14900 [Brevibacillus ginsengisoli]|uniref:hypothetical protein n=1 Tax=Brevibacillus ginsengisoli TaxID=363854 RepID=UPI003CF7750A
MGIRKVILSLLLLVLVVTVQPHLASAYSYGNPNEEAVAEVYKKVVAALNQTPPDFAGAKTSFLTVKEELDMHMGTKPGEAIAQSLDQQNKAAAIDAFQKTLVLNVARRLDGVDKDFTDYKQGKLLLAKGLATYDALSPVVKAKDPALDQKIRQDFEQELQSLGNPGLFGVGVKAPDQALFKTKKDEILKTLQEQFQLKSLEVGHFSVGADVGNQKEQGSAASSMGGLKNWLPIIVILLVLALIIIRTLRKRRA